MNFQARLTTAEQVEDVEVYGWDVKNKQAIIGKSSTPQGTPTVNNGNHGGQKMPSEEPVKKSLIITRYGHRVKQISSPSQYLMTTAMHILKRKAPVWVILPYAPVLKSKLKKSETGSPVVIKSHARFIAMTCRDILRNLKSAAIAPTR